MAFIDTFPLLSSAVFLKDSISWEYLQSLGVPNWVCHCDVYIPENICFIPIQYKEYDISGNKKKCLYCTGTLSNMWLCDIDMKEIIRYGGSVIRIHSAMIWTKNIPNPFKDIILE